MQQDSEQVLSEQLKGVDFFEIFPWDKNFETGIAEIDLQHRKLVQILNQLAAHLANLSTEFTLNKIFQELADYADYHFKAEEGVWGKYLKGDSSFDAHLKTHNSFLGKVLAIKDSESEKAFDDVIRDLVSFLSQWLAHHILDSDKRMAKVVLAVEAGKSVAEAKVLADKEMSGSMQLLIETVLSMYDKLSTRTLNLMREKAMRRKAEEALVISEEQLQFVLTESGESLWDWNIGHSGQQHPFRNSDSLQPGKSIERIEKEIHPEDLPTVKRKLQEHLQGKTELYSSRHRVLNTNGGWTWRLSRGKVISRDEEGTPLRMVGTHSNITERELASGIYHHSNQGMIVCDGSNTIISANPAFTTLTGFSEKDVLGKNPSFLSSGEHGETFYAEMWRAIEREGCWQGEIDNRRKNGELFSTSVTINAILDASGHVEQYIALFTDITERKRIEDQLLSSEKMTLIAGLAAGVAHELNTPLSGILQGVQLLEQGVDPAYGKNAQEAARYNLDLDALQNYFADKDLDFFLNGIRESATKASKIIVELLQFSRPNTQLATGADLSRLITSSIELTKTDYTLKKEYNVLNVEFVREDSGTLPSITCVVMEIEQVLINLFKNSCQAMAEDSSCLDPTIVIRTHLDNEMVVIEVEDNGPGMAAEVQQQIFNPFFTTKEVGSGTGLGLTVSHSIVCDKHGGRMKVTSTQGQGTTIAVMLPVSGPLIMEADTQGQTG